MEFVEKKYLYVLRNEKRVTEFKQTIYTENFSVMY